MTDAVLPDLLQTALLNGVLALWRLFFGPTSRTYWPYLAVSLVVAVWLWRRERAARGALPAHLDVFSARTWLGRSAINDYWLVLLNAILFGGLLASLVPQGGLLAGLLGEIIGGAAAAGPHASAPALAAVGLALWIFLADDFARFAAHWMEHRIPALWELHKVHHSAEVLNFVTAERHHPVSLAFYAVLITSVVGAANLAFLTVFPDAVAPATLIGANAFWLCANLLASSLRHSPVWLSFGPTVERWLISPAQHQVHHSENPAHFDRNFGSTLAVWDRLFGTLHLTGPQREVRTFGLGEQTRLYRSPAALYLRPFVRSMARLAGRATPD
jgi:sterol desaturase/sphingolipid hydroxylase (fatty acid hydroxylase superfamily)